MFRHSWSVLLVASSLALAGVACGGPPEARRPGAVDGGKPHERPDQGGAGGSGGAGGGAGGEGGDAGGTVELDWVRPPRGLLAGGEVVILKGRGFLEGTGKPRVDFGSNPSLSVRVIDDETVYVEAPPGKAGEVDVAISSSPGGRAVCVACYRYVGGATLRSVEPANGSVHGGDRIVLRGTGLGEGMTVTFGSRAALDPLALEDGSLEVTLPPGDGHGPVDVRVFGEEGHASLRKAFEYLAPLRIDSVDPPGGPLAGGGRIHVNGAGFTPDATLVLDGAPLATRFDSTGRISALVPAGAFPGAVPLEVVSAHGSTAATYAYVAPCPDGGVPAIYSVAPPRASVNGGDTVSLVGTCLDDDKLAVRFGGSFAPEAEADGPHFVRAVIPAAPSSGTVDVEVRVATGAGSLPGSFRYVSPIVIDSLSPASGGVQGGDVVQVFGSGFPEGARLFIGALEATGVAWVSDRQLTAITPRGTDGAVPVRIVDPADPSNETILPGGFRYDGPLSLSAVEPSLGARAGGTLVTLRGSGFRDGMEVRFGQAQAGSVDVQDPFTAIATTPKGNVGLVDVSAVRHGMAPATLAGSFAYVDPASTYGGSSGGLLAGSLNVTVLDAYGAPLQGATVSLGGDDGGFLGGVTDERGQLTLSSPLLVKPQSVSVFKPGFEGATVVGQRSENLTVLLQSKGGGGTPGFPSFDRGRVSGRVWGFKLPPNRVLGPGEHEVALVSHSARSVYHTPPFGSALPPVVVQREGGSFTLSVDQARGIAVYAVYGIQRADGSVEKLAMGVTRNVNPIMGKEIGVDVIIDTHLDQEVPVTVENPPGRLGTGSASVFAFLDLGGEGVIPVGEAFTGGMSSGSGRFTGLPNLTAGNFLFEAWGGRSGAVFPLTVAFRRQLGDLSRGITVGPLLGLTTFTKSWSGADGTIEWRRDPGPTPVFAYVLIEEANSGTPVWHAVLPGTETRFTIPTPILERLLAESKTGVSLRVTLVQGTEPRFDFGQWGYADMGLNAYTSFTYDILSFRL